MTQPQEIPVDDMPDPLTALTDPNNVRFIPLEEYEDGFTDEQVAAILNAPPEIIASSGNGES